MPKHYKDMMDEIINKIDEDAPTNAVAHGGVDMNPTGKKAKLIKKKDDILKRVGVKIKENNDLYFESKKFVEWLLKYD